MFVTDWLRHQCHSTFNKESELSHEIVHIYMFSSPRSTNFQPTGFLKNQYICIPHEHYFYLSIVFSICTCQLQRISNPNWGWTEHFINCTLTQFLHKSTTEPRLRQLYQRIWPSQSGTTQLTGSQNGLEYVNEVAFSVVACLEPAPASPVCYPCCSCNCCNSWLKSCKNLIKNWLCLYPVYHLYIEVIGPPS